MARVRVFQTRYAGSIPVTRSQWQYPAVEYRNCDVCAGGSGERSADSIFGRN